LEKSTKGWTLRELADILEGTLEGPEDLVIHGPTGADGGRPDQIAFAVDEEYYDMAIATEVGALIVTPDMPKSSKPLIRVDKPKQAFGKFLALCQNSMPLEEGIHPTAVIAPTAQIDPTASVGAYAVIESGAKIGARTRIFPFAFIGTDCEVGTDTTIFPHVVLYSNVVVGNNTLIHSHAVLGCDGFGFTWNGSKHVKVPHLGKTEIGSDVEIGSCTAIDRGMLTSTKIGDGSKIDNMVQVGHNTVVGQHTIIVSQTGIAGSCEIGDRCTLAGQVGLADHVKIGNDVILTARSAVARNLLQAGPYRGVPAIPYREELKYEASLRRVPQLLKRVKELEQKLEKLSAICEA
jgi:UDP-3-O-[3-hydroxymyristoyl] glucosamine N-acyltransferase